MYCRTLVLYNNISTFVSLTLFAYPMGNRPNIVPTIQTPAVTENTFENCCRHKFRPFLISNVKRGYQPPIATTAHHSSASQHAHHTVRVANHEASHPIIRPLKHWYFRPSTQTGTEHGDMHVVIMTSRHSSGGVLWRHQKLVNCDAFRISRCGRKFGNI